MASWRWKTKHFAKQHGNLLTFLGAAIVFLTFVSKEGFSEHWKTIADSIDAAQYVYSIRTDTSAEQFYFSEVLQRLEFLESTMNRAKDKNETNNINYSAIRAEGNKANLAKLKVTVSDITILTDKLPMEDDIKRQMEKFTNELHNAEDELNKIDAVKRGDSTKLVPHGQQFTNAQIESLRHWTDKFAQHDVYWQYESERAGLVFPRFYSTNDPTDKRESQLDKSLYALQADVDFFNNEALERAKRVREHNEVLADWARATGGLLFTIGLLLGFVGHVYGVETGGARSD